MTPPGDTGVSVAGRDDDLSVAAGALRPGAPGVVIVGTRGIGRTTLLRELAQRESRRRVVHRLVCAHHAARQPLSALAPLLDPSARADLPDLLRVSPDAVPVEHTAMPALIVVDDAHLLDSRSALVLRQLVATRRITLALTIARGHRTDHEVAAMLRDDGLVHLDLAPLGRDQLDLALRAITGRSVERGTLDEIWAATDGNPSFAIAYAEGPAARRNERLAHTATRALDGLPRSARRAAELIAAGGVVTMAALGSLGLERAARALHDAGLVRTVRESSIERTDELTLAPRALAIGVRHLLGAAGVRSACRSLLAVAATNGPTLLHARWRLDAGERAPAAWWLAAARSAEDASDPVLRSRCAEAAVAAGAGPRGLLELARALSSAGAGLEAEAILTDLAHDEEGGPRGIEVLVARAWNLGFVLHRPDEAQQLLEQAESRSTDPTEQAELVCLRASLALHARGPDEALVAARNMLDAETPLPARLHIATTLAPALSVVGRWEQSADLTGDFLQHADAATSPLTRMRVAAVHHWARLQSGHIDESLDASESASAAAERAGNVGEAAVWRLGHGYAALVGGRIATAESSLASAESALRRVDLFGYLPLCLAARGRVFALLGDASRARGALDEADQLVASTHPFTALDTGPDRAWMHACLGDLVAAGELATSSASRAIASGHTGVAVRLLWDVAIFGRSADAAAFAESAGAHVEGPLAAAILDGVRGLHHGEPALLADVATRFEQIGAFLLAHTAAASAAHGLRAMARDAEAERMAVRATALLSRCEGARSPLPPLLGRVRLTPREQQVAMLAGSSASNHELAEQLGVSVRTVETHLHRVYMKLGVSGRAELAAIWHDRLRTGEPART